MTRRQSDLRKAWQRGYMKGRAFGKRHTNGNGNGHAPATPDEALQLLTVAVRRQVLSDVQAQLRSVTEGAA